MKITRQVFWISLLLSSVLWAQGNWDAQTTLKKMIEEQKADPADPADAPAYVRASAHRRSSSGIAYVLTPSMITVMQTHGRVAIDYSDLLSVVGLRIRVGTNKESISGRLVKVDENNITLTRSESSGFEVKVIERRIVRSIERLEN
jgi:hypothetical protein